MLQCVAVCRSMLQRVAMAPRTEELTFESFSSSSYSFSLSSCQYHPGPEDDSSQYYPREKIHIFKKPAHHQIDYMKWLCE